MPRRHGDALAQQRGDTRAGMLADNLVGFGRALRRAGIAVDSARMALASEAMLLVGPDRRADVGAALESVLVGREPDRGVFRELFDAWFRDPAAGQALADLLPGAGFQAEPPGGRARVRDALAPRSAPVSTLPPKPERETDHDAAMTAGDLARLRHADFNGLAASEYQQVERLVRDIHLPVPF